MLEDDVIAEHLTEDCSGLIMMEVKGIATMMRRKPCALAWSSAKASEASVLPPPVGTSMVKMPRGRLALRRACAKISARNSLTTVTVVPPKCSAT